MMRPCSLSHLTFRIILNSVIFYFTDQPTHLKFRRLEAVNRKSISIKSIDYSTNSTDSFLLQNHNLLQSIWFRFPFMHSLVWSSKRLVAISWQWKSEYFHFVFVSWSILTFVTRVSSFALSYSTVLEVPCFGSHVYLTPKTSPQRRSSSQRSLSSLACTMV